MIYISFGSKFFKVFIIGILTTISKVFPAETIDSEVLDISIDYSNDPIYSELWFWIIIAFILLLILILLIIGGGRKCKLNKEESAKNFIQENEM